MSELISREDVGDVCIVRLNRPEKKNALSRQLFVDFTEVLNEVGADDSIRVVVLTGAGEHFSVGADLKDSSSAPGGNEEMAYRTSERALLAFEKPILAAVTGFAIGGGATIPLACDLVYVGERLRMRFPFTALGLAPEFASSYLLPAQIGPQKAAEFLMTSEWIDADMAVESGIALAKFSDEELLDEVMEKAKAIAELAPNSVKETKLCLRTSQARMIEMTLEMEHEAMDRQAMSPENMEAMMAFMQKRKPDFSNVKKS